MWFRRIASVPHFCWCKYHLSFVIYRKSYGLCLRIFLFATHPRHRKCWNTINSYFASVCFLSFLFFLSAREIYKQWPNDACWLSVNGTAQFIYFYDFVCVCVRCACLVFYLMVWHRWIVCFGLLSHFLGSQQTALITTEPINMNSYSELVSSDRSNIFLDQVIAKKIVRNIHRKLNSSLIRPWFRINFSLEWIQLQPHFLSVPLKRLHM